MASKYLQFAYEEGALLARQKLATEAGPIAYAPRSSEEHMNHEADNAQESWAVFDRKFSDSTGGSGTKTADSGDMSQSSPGHGAYSQGGRDASAADPERFKRMSSSMEEAFNSNEDYDQSYGEESAMTQPHGSKYAAGMGLGGLGSGMPSSSTSMMGIAGAPKPPQAPKMPKAPGMPGMKAPSVTDPRGDKPPGMNLQHSLQTSVSAADSQAGFGSPQRRQMGSSI